MSAGELPHRELDGLFDVPEVVVLTSEIDPRALAFVTDREAALVAKAVDKRKREFATGRALAKAALARVGRREREILNGPDRAPIWPEGVTGSISHCNTRAVVAVGLRPRAGTIGVDIEHRDELGRHLFRSVFLPDELGFLEREVPDHARGRVALALFSAKEALYKAQYPRSTTYMGFHDLRVDLGWEGSPEDIRRGTLRCTFQRDVDPFPRQTVVHGRFRFDAFPSGEVVTAVRVP